MNKSITDNEVFAPDSEQIINSEVCQNLVADPISESINKDPRTKEENLPDLTIDKSENSNKSTNMEIQCEVVYLPPLNLLPKPYVVGTDTGSELKFTI